MSDRRTWIALALFLAVTYAAAAFGAQFSPGEWFQGLNKPSWNPPSSVFGPVWTTLYTLMGIAAWRVWKSGPTRETRPALILYFVQLAVNAAWSWLFFGRQNPEAAFYDIVVLLALLIATTYAFFRRDTWAGVMLLPYVAWVSFATALNYTIWQMNG